MSERIVPVIDQVDEIAAHLKRIEAEKLKRINDQSLESVTSADLLFGFDLARTHPEVEA